MAATGLMVSLTPNGPSPSSTSLPACASLTARLRTIVLLGLTMSKGRLQSRKKLKVWNFPEPLSILRNPEIQRISFSPF